MRIIAQNGARLCINERDLLTSQIGLSHAFATDVARRIVRTHRTRVKVVPNASQTGWCIRPHAPEVTP